MDFILLIRKKAIFIVTFNVSVIYYTVVPHVPLLSCPRLIFSNVWWGDEMYQSQSCLHQRGSHMFSGAKLNLLRKKREFKLYQLLFGIQK